MAAPQVHPTAVVADDAALHDGVVVGPFAVVEDGVAIEAGARLEVGAVVRRGTVVGAGARLGPYAVIGSLPMDTNFRGEASGVRIGAGADLREYVTVHRATGEGATTVVGPRALVMTGAHVSHNAVVGADAVLTAQVQLAGHVEVGDGAVLGAGVMVHQWTRIGRLAMVGATSALNADVLPFAMARGNPARHFRLNAIGLRRRGVPTEARNALQDALRCLRRRDAAGLAALADAWPDVAELTAFVAASRRGVARFASVG